MIALISLIIFRKTSRFLITSGVFAHDQRKLRNQLISDYLQKDFQVFNNFGSVCTRSAKSAKSTNQRLSSERLPGF